VTFMDFLNRTFRHWSLLPAVLLFVLLTIYPVANLFRMSVSTITFTQGRELWTFTPLANLGLLRADEVIRPAVSNTLIFVVVPVVFLILFAAVEALPIETLEAARVDGATRWQLVRRVMLPLLRPAIVVALVFRTILAFKVFDEVYLLTSGGPGTSTELVTLHLYKVFFEQNQLGYGALLSLALIAAIVAFLLVGWRAMRSARR